MQIVVSRVAGLDVHKDTALGAVRSPGEGGRRVQVVREFSTFWRDLEALCGWLAESGVSLVVMEATGVYWKPVRYALEELAGVEVMLVNARHVKNLPVLRGSLVPPREIAELRDLTR